VIASLAFAEVGGLGVLYVGVALPLGAIMLSLVRRPITGALYAYSIVYLVILFGAMLADRLAPF